MSRSTIAILGVSLLCGCGSEDPRPEPLGSGVTQTGPTIDLDDFDAGEPPDCDPATEIGSEDTFSGTVRLLDDPTLSLTEFNEVQFEGLSRFNGIADLEIDSALCEPSIARTAEDGTFTLEHVMPSLIEGRSSLRVYPVSSEDVAVVPTITGVRRGTVDGFDAALLTLRVVEDIASLLINPVELDPDAAHVVIKTVDAVDRSARDGVTVNGLQGTRGYDDGTNDGATGTLGLAFFLNIPVDDPEGEVMTYQAADSFGLEQDNTILAIPGAVNISLLSFGAALP